VKKKRKIRRRCKCGCGSITNYGKKYLRGHHRRNIKLSKEMKKKIGKGNKGKIHTEESKEKMRGPKSEEARKNMSLAKQNMSEETKLNISLGHIKYNPDYQYGCEWQDPEYRKDLCKNYCENKNCKGISKRLCNHHIFLDKKRCAPDEVMTLCNSCHPILHRLLEEEQYKKINPKDFIIINRIDHVSYINKSTRKIIRINKEI